jgi:site-specific DNA-methyltransferase (adenine-specific)
MTDVDLRLGDWREVLADVERVDAVIVDAPYSARTHGGHDWVKSISERSKRHGRKVSRRQLSYSAWGEDDVNALVDHWGERCGGWFVSLTDHVLAPYWSSAMEMPENGGRYVFAPLPFVARGARVRLSGDGPSSWTTWIVVGRPATRAFAKWGTLPGAYVLPPGENDLHATIRKDTFVTGGKPLWLMRQLVRDYTRPGDTVCDPCSGAATTALACRLEGRRFVGAEVDPATHAKAMARLARYPVSTETQPALFDRVEAAQ